MSQPMVEIVETLVDERSGTSQKTGKPYTIRQQIAWFWTPGVKYPQQIKIQLERQQVPYAPGKYMIDLPSFTVGRFGDLALRSSLVLKAIPATSAIPKVA